MRALACLPALGTVAVLATGCGPSGSSSTSNSFTGASHAAAQAVYDLQTDSRNGDTAKICSNDLSSALVSRLSGGAGGQDCQTSVKNALNEVDDFTLTVNSVSVNGSTATAKVTSLAQGHNTQSTLTLVQESGRWKVTGLL